MHTSSHMRAYTHGVEKEEQESVFRSVKVQYIHESRYEKTYKPSAVNKIKLKSFHYALKFFP